MSPFLQTWLQLKRWPNSRKVDVFCSLYSVVIQAITPHHLTFITCIAWHDGAEKEKITCCGDTTHRLCRTSKHIFWLGKNKFDSIKAPMQGLRAWRP